MDAFWQGRYQFGVQERIMLAGGEMIDMWSSRDALVVKVLIQVPSGSAEGCSFRLVM